MAIHKNNTSVRTQKSHLPRNAREAVLSAFDLMAAFTTAEDVFVSTNALTRTGKVEPDCADISLPFTTRIRCGHPRWQGRANRRVAAVFAASFTTEDLFTGPDTLVRTGQFEFEDGLMVPFTEYIEFSRPA